jgi:hypothetical protein
MLFQLFDVAAGSGRLRTVLPLNYSSGKRSLADSERGVLNLAFPLVQRKTRIILRRPRLLSCQACGSKSARNGDIIKTKSGHHHYVADRHP